MALAHDAICGGLARMYHLASANADLSMIAVVFARFEAAYASHAETEAFETRVNRVLTSAGAPV